MRIILLNIGVFCVFKVDCILELVILIDVSIKFYFGMLVVVKLSIEYRGSILMFLF